MFKLYLFLYRAYTFVLVRIYTYFRMFEVFARRQPQDRQDGRPRPFFGPKPCPQPRPLHRRAGLRRGPPDARPRGPQHAVDRPAAPRPRPAGRPPREGRRPLRSCSPPPEPAFTVQGGAVSVSDWARPPCHQHKGTGARLDACTHAQKTHCSLQHRFPELYTAVLLRETLQSAEECCITPLLHSGGVWSLLMFSLRSLLTTDLVFLKQSGPKRLLPNRLRGWAQTPPTDKSRQNLTHPDKSR